MIADIIALDRDDRPVLVAEVKPVVLGPQSGPPTEQLRRLMRAFDAPYGMLIDLERISIFQRAGGDLPAAYTRSLNTVDVLSHYSPDFRGKDTRYGSLRIFHEYLTTLVEGWLRDVAYHWKSATPPGAEELAGIGLVERLEEGTTRSEVRIGGTALR